MQQNKPICTGLPVEVSVLRIETSWLPRVVEFLSFGLGEIFCGKWAFCPYKIRLGLGILLGGKGELGKQSLTFFVFLEDLNSGEGRIKVGQTTSWGFIPCTVKLVTLQGEKITKCNFVVLLWWRQVRINTPADS